MRDIIKSRVEEIIETTKSTLEKSGVPSFLINNIILTGGVSSIVGIDKLTAEIFNRNARIGYPSQIDEIPAELTLPSYSCSLGMLVFLKNLYLKEKTKGGFESKNHWFRNLIEKLVSV